MTPDGLVTCPSRHGPKETMDRLAAAVTDQGMSVLARMDHAAAAAEVGLTLRPTEVLIFGNPRGGTPLMQVAQTIGIDLPLKALVWQDEAGKTWLSYNDPEWLAQRHHAAAGTGPVRGTDRRSLNRRQRGDRHRLSNHLVETSAPSQANGLKIRKVSTSVLKRPSKRSVHLAIAKDRRTSAPCHVETFADAKRRRGWLQHTSRAMLIGERPQWRRLLVERPRPILRTQSTSHVGPGLPTSRF
jgi:uncharacterized protein (DUF302 family)